MEELTNFGVELSSVVEFSEAKAQKPPSFFESSRKLIGS